METAETALQAQVFKLLQAFNGTEPLKELFWSRLSYDRINQRTTRRGWPASLIGWRKCCMD